MTKQVINIGAVANDGTGDTVRLAMIKTNSNFQELYSTYGDGTTLGGYVKISDLKTIIAASADFDDFKVRVATIPGV